MRESLNEERIHTRSMTLANLLPTTMHIVLHSLTVASLIRWHLAVNLSRHSFEAWAHFSRWWNLLRLYCKKGVYSYLNRTLVFQRSPRRTWRNHRESQALKYLYNVLWKVTNTWQISVSGKKTIGEYFFFFIRLKKRFSSKRSQRLSRGDEKRIKWEKGRNQS